MNHVNLVHTLGDNIKIYRKHLGFTQEQLGQVSKISKANVGYAEQGRTNLGVASIGRIAHALNVNPCLLLSKPVKNIRGVGLDDLEISPLILQQDECAFCINSRGGMEYYPLVSDDGGYMIALFAYLKKKGYYDRRAIEAIQNTRPGLYLKP